MGDQIRHPRGQAAWTLAKRQHGVVARGQLLKLGFSAKAIKHRVATGRLHPMWRGVYTVGRAQITPQGHWMAALLACGATAVLSHETAAALWRIRARSRPIEVSVAAHGARGRPGIVVHRRSGLRQDDVTRHQGIPVTTPALTLVDLATRIGRRELEAAVNEADRLDLVTPPQLRMALDQMPRHFGIRPLCDLLDGHAFTLTDSELERRFMPLAHQAALSRPLTRQIVNGYRVDFYWPDLGLIVETDGLRYHRTAAQQTRDRRRDQAHAAAGLTHLRFTHAQVVFEPDHVVATLSAVARRLQSRTRLTALRE